MLNVGRMDDHFLHLPQLPIIFPPSCTDVLWNSVDIGVDVDTSASADADAGAGNSSSFSIQR